MLIASCASHKRSHIQGNEQFVIELQKPATRGGMIDIALQGLFLGANYLAEKSAKSLTSSYTHSISINDYYNTDLGEVEKTYETIHIKKYSKPKSPEIKEHFKDTLIKDYSAITSNTRGPAPFAMEEVIREKDDDLLNFDAIIKLISDEENPGITRLSFEQLRIFFSKTKVFTDENLNAKVSIKITGEWRDTSGTPIKQSLMEQEYNFRNIKYGPENQISEPILSPWYYDVPITPDVEDASRFGIVDISIQLEEYEGKKSKYINQLPDILSDNKKSIISNGSSTIEKIIDKK